MDLHPVCLPGLLKRSNYRRKYVGFDTDDLVVFVKQPNSYRETRLLAQIKHNIAITQKNETFAEIIQAAWNDFNNQKLFTVGQDSIALITGPLSSTNTEVRTILETARHSEDANDFLERINLAKFHSASNRSKLETFKAHLKNANGGTDISDEELWKFMKSFHLLGYDLDIKVGSNAFSASFIDRAIFSRKRPGFVVKHC